MANNYLQAAFAVTVTASEARLIAAVQRAIEAIDSGVEGGGFVGPASVGGPVVCKHDSLGCRVVDVGVDGGDGGPAEAFCGFPGVGSGEDVAGGAVDEDRFELAVDAE